MEEQKQKELEEKQRFLKTEIMDQNYNTEEFTEYISNLKDNGTDLNNWTLDELKEIVVSFKNQQNSVENSEENIEKEVENVKNSFILSKSDTEEKLKSLNDNDKTILNHNKNNPYDLIFDNKEEEFQKIPNIMSDIKGEERKKNSLRSEFGEFEIIDPSELIDYSIDKIKCEKQKENSLSHLDDINVDIIG